MDHREDCQLLTVETYGLCTCDFDERMKAEHDLMIFGRSFVRELPNGSVEHIPIKDVILVDDTPR